MASRAGYEWAKRPQLQALIPFDDYNLLRRASMTLRRWAEHECNGGKVADREKGALKRIGAICTRLGLHYYHQGDPRGCALYVSVEPLTGSNYNRGVAIG